MDGELDVTVTSIAQRAYIGITVVYYIDGAFELKSTLLDCVALAADKHTTAEIASSMAARFAF